MNTMVFCSSVCRVRKLVLHLPPYERVEATEGLVHEQHVGIGRQCPGEADTLLHPPAHLPGVVVLPTLQPHDSDGLQRSLVPGLLVHPPHFQAVHHVLYDVAVREKAVVLEDHGDLAAAELHQLLRSICADVLAIETDPPRSGLREPDEAAHQGRLAAAGQSHDDEDLSRVHAERDVSEPDHDTQRPADLLPAHGLALRQQGSFRVLAEYLPEVADLYLTNARPHVRMAPGECPYATRYVQDSDAYRWVQWMFRPGKNLFRLAYSTMHRALTGLLADGIAELANHRTAHLPPSGRWVLTSEGVFSESRLRCKPLRAHQRNIAARVALREPPHTPATPDDSPLAEQVPQDSGTDPVRVGTGG